MLLLFCVARPERLAYFFLMTNPPPIMLPREHSAPVPPIPSSDCAVFWARREAGTMSATTFRPVYRADGRDPHRAAQDFMRDNGDEVTGHNDGRGPLYSLDPLYSLEEPGEWCESDEGRFQCRLELDGSITVLERQPTEARHAP